MKSIGRPKKLGNKNLLRKRFSDETWFIFENDQQLLLDLLLMLRTSIMCLTVFQSVEPFPAKTKLAFKPKIFFGNFLDNFLHGPLTNYEYINDSLYTSI